MSMMMRISRRVRGGDNGAAMMIVLLAGAVLTASAIVAVTVSSANLRNAGRDRVSSGALNAAEAGVAEAVNYLRTALSGDLSCSPNCAGNPWGNSTTPQQSVMPDGATATVYISVVQPFSPPAYKQAVYRINSTGRSGQGPGQRIIQQTVTGTPVPIPIGVYANTITMNGTPQTFQESVFSKDCIRGRNQMNFGSQPDAYFGIVPAAHSTKWISTGNGSCDGSNNNNIHKNGVCNPAYAYDQDAQGGPVSSPCAPPGNTSLFTQADLDGYGRGLTQSELERLRTQAKSQGNYWTSATSWTAPNPATSRSAVIFFDVGPNATVTIQNELDGWAWDGSCASTPRTLIVVVNNSSVGSGGLTINANGSLAGALFVQRGQLKFNGTITWTGTLFADSIQQWNGNATSQLTSCFLANLPGGMMDITPTRFREVDR